MPQLMLCTQCHDVVVPETVLSGSDFAELLGWSCLAVPGWLYCFWRHWNRAKACPACGSHALMRQSRASAARLAARHDPAPSARAVIRNETGPVRWPAPFHRPKDRLRDGTRGALPAALALLAWLLSAAGWLPPLPALVGMALLASIAWVVHRGMQLFRIETAARCQAWDDKGRSLRITAL